MAESAKAREAAAHQTVSCREITGLECDYVAAADGNPASVGYHVDQVMSLLGQHLGEKHRTGLDLDERNAIRARFSGLG